MTASTRRTLGAIGLLWIGFAAASSASTTASADPAAETTLARGRYLVEKVAMCADCHSPRDQKGQFVSGQWLRGSPLAFQPTVPMPWSPAAPAIAGLPTMTVEQGIAYFQTGVRPDGSRPLPPMPEFRFSAEDSYAVVAYLKSLAP